MELVFNVQEGELLPLRRSFEGNTIYTDKELKRRIQTKESSWIIIKRNYDETVAEADPRGFVMLTGTADFDMELRQAPVERINDKGWQ